jgi:hypothetical protein
MKGLRTCVRTFSLVKSGPLNTNTSFTLNKAVIRSVMTYACPTREYARDAHILKLPSLQSGLRPFRRLTAVSE